MIYEYNYRNTRIAITLAVVLLLMGVACFGFLFIGISSGGGNNIEIIEEFNWSLVAVFIPVFIVPVISIIAAISAQKRKQELAMEQHTNTQAPLSRNFKPFPTRTRPTTIFCSLCGEKLEKEALFCPQCGTDTRQ